MRVGVFIDGFNLYYGAQVVCGQDTQGWKWMDLGRLIGGHVPPSWGGISEIHYCTALRGRGGRPQSLDQDAYLAALREHDPRVRVHLGKYVRRLKRGVLGGADRRPVPWVDTEVPPWLTARPVSGAEGDVQVLVSVLAFEEKGSDVNVASSLLAASMSGDVDAAVVVSNDSDLALALRFARSRVPVGLLNPGRRATASDLRGDPQDGVGGHWWGRISEHSYRAAQLPDTVATWCRPADW